MSVFSLRLRTPGEGYEMGSDTLVTLLTYDNGEPLQMAAALQISPARKGLCFTQPKIKRRWQNLYPCPVPPPFPTTTPDSSFTSSSPAQRRTWTVGSEAQEMSV